MSTIVLIFQFLRHIKRGLSPIVHQLSIRMMHRIQTESAITLPACFPETSLAHLLHGENDMRQVLVGGAKENNLERKWISCIVYAFIIVRGHEHIRVRSVGGCGWTEFIFRATVWLHLEKEDIGAGFRE